MKYPGMTWGLMEAVVNKLGGMEGVNRFLSGNAEVVVKSHIIDCDAEPFNPWEKDGWTVEEHQKGGQLVWDASKVDLFLADGQKNGKVLEGNKLHRELSNKPVLNACVLDYLLANPHLIPEEWKGRFVFFWGTIYRNHDGRLIVRRLFGGGDGWGWHCNWLTGGWDGGDPAALRAS